MVERTDLEPLQVAKIVGSEFMNVIEYILSTKFQSQIVEPVFEAAREPLECVEMMIDRFPTDRITERIISTRHALVIESIIITSIKALNTCLTS